MTSTIKRPKIQETSTIKLISCISKNLKDEKFCTKDSKKEIVPNLVRRIVLPFYIPVISLLCSFLLIQNNIRVTNKIFIYSFSILLLIFTELFIRYTGINYFLRIGYIFLPFAIFFISYSALKIKLKTSLR